METIGRQVATRRGGRARAARYAALVLLAYGLVFAFKLAIYGGDVSAFVTAGDTFFDHRRLDYPIAVLQGSDGYDGQFYYRLALDPATKRQTEHGIRIDSPTVRAQRIGYPALAWLLSGGNGRRVPYALVALNLAALAGIGWLGAGLAGALGAAPRHGLLFAFYPGFVLTLARDTTEIVATFLALLALTLATRGRAVAAGLIGAAAVLTRETTLLYLAGFGMMEAWLCIAQRRPSTALFAYLLPPLAYLGWQAVLRHQWGMWAISDVGVHDFGFPPLARYCFWVWRYAVDALSTPFRFRFLFGIVSILATGGFVAWVSWTALRARQVAIPYLVPWIAYAAMTALFTDAVWLEPWGYLRVLSDAYAIGVALLFVVRSGAVPRALSALVAVLWLGAIGFIV